MIAADAVVPLKMDAGGTAGDPAQQLIGSTAGYAYAAAGAVMLGSFSSSYNQLRRSNDDRGWLQLRHAGQQQPTVGDRWTLFSRGFDTAAFASITVPQDTKLSGYELVAVSEPSTGFMIVFDSAAVDCRLITSRRSLMFNPLSPT